MMNNQAVLQATLSTSAPQSACITVSSSAGEPSLTNQSLEPIRFIAVGGPYHTGSTVSYLLYAFSINSHEMILCAYGFNDFMMIFCMSRIYGTPLTKTLLMGLLLPKILH
jgi:hypothetical protein